MDDSRYRGLLAEVESESGLSARRRGLPPSLPALHQRILRQFAVSGAAPTPETLRAWAAELAINPSAALRTLVGVDLIQGDPDTLLVYGAYPFTSTPRGHRVDIVGGSAVEAYCAADALGISAMLDRAVTIVSHDPQTGAEVRVHVRNGKATSEPPGAVVSIPLTPEDPDGQVCDCSCPVVSFYTSPENARAYARAHGLSLDTLTLSQAHRLGSAVFRGHIAPDADAPGGLVAEVGEA
jgi:hypothetical protein